MASKRRRRRRECEKKRRFSSPEEAGGLLDHLRRIGKARPGLHSYPCQFCGGWHVGRGGKKLKRRRIKSWQWNQGV